MSAAGSARATMLALMSSAQYICVALALPSQPSQRAPPFTTIGVSCTRLLLGGALTGYNIHTHSKR